MEGEIMTYESINNNIIQDDEMKFPRNFLESINLPCIPSHILKLKVGCPIILLRNIR